ncbi:MAG: hypothetical protein ABID84_00700 [Chloroflexota bacterium]
MVTDRDLGRMGGHPPNCSCEACSARRLGHAPKPFNRGEGPGKEHPVDCDCNVCKLLRDAKLGMLSSEELKPERGNPSRMTIWEKETRERRKLGERRQRAGRRWLGRGLASLVLLVVGYVSFEAYSIYARMDELPSPEVVLEAVLDRKDSVTKWVGNLGVELTSYRGAGLPSALVEYNLLVSRQDSLSDRNVAIGDRVSEIYTLYQRDYGQLPSLLLGLSTPTEVCSLYGRRNVDSKIAGWCDELDKLDRELTANNNEQSEIEHKRVNLLRGLVSLCQQLGGTTVIGDDIMGLACSGGGGKIIPWDTSTPTP